MQGETKTGARSRLGIAALLLGVLLMVPSVWIGFVLDDYIYRNTLEGTLAGRSSAAELFVFAGRDAGLTARFLEIGGYPWWTDDALQLALFRPLSSLTMRIDDVLFGSWAIGHHLHSLLWWAGLLLVVAALFRRVLPGRLGALALLLFALDVSHVFPAGWISNRNALIAALPALAGLVAHLRWREDGWKPGRWLGPAGLAVGLLGGEVAVGVFGFFVAYELFAAPGPWRKRVAALAPAVAVGVVYVALYRLLGYGTSGSGIYLDPLASPAEFLATAPTRLSILLCGALVGPPADLWMLAPPIRPALVVLGLLGAGFLGLLVRWLWSSLAPEVHRALRWLVAGAALSVVPSLATFPADRLFLVPSLGVCAALAVAIAGGWRARRSGRSAPARLFLAAAALGLGFVHLVLSPLHVLGLQVGLLVQQQTTEAVAREVELGSEPAEQDVIVVAAPDFVVGIYAPLIRMNLGLPLPREWRLLSLAPHAHRLTRTGPTSLLLEVQGGAMMTTLFEQLYREPEPPLRPGDVIRRGWLEVEIVEADARGPTAVAFRFDRELEDPSLRFLRWQDGALRRFEVPGVGESVFLPRTLGPVGF